VGRKPAAMSDGGPAGGAGALKRPEFQVSERPS
jgi:hypothetical protein